MPDRAHARGETGAPETPPVPTQRAVVVAGHTGDADTARAGLDHLSAGVRTAALGALDRLGALGTAELQTALADPEVSVRRRAVEIAAKRPTVDLVGALHDADPRVVEVAAWSCGEHGRADDTVLDRLIELTTTAADPLVRESAAAALGAIGDDRGLPAILAACADRPAVRRRAVLALAPFLADTGAGDQVRAALDRALTDRDWQVRQAAEDLRRAIEDEPDQSS